MTKMGIVNISEDEKKELMANVGNRTTDLRTIVQEVSNYFESNKKAKELVYDVSSYCSQEPEPDRMHKAKLIASGLQKYTKIWAKAVSKTTNQGLRFYIIMDKTKEIAQPSQLIGKRKTVKA